jgi:hypothetical protein
MSRPQNLAEAVVVAELGHELRPVDVPTWDGDHAPGEGGGLVHQVGELDLDVSLPDRDAERSESGHHTPVDPGAAGDVGVTGPGQSKMSVGAFFFLFYHPLP